MVEGCRGKIMWGGGGGSPHTPSPHICMSARCPPDKTLDLYILLMYKKWCISSGFVGFRNCKWVGSIYASKVELPFDDAPWQHSFYKVTLVD